MYNVAWLYEHAADFLPKQQPSYLQSQNDPNVKCEPESSSPLAHMIGVRFLPSFS